MGFASHIKSDGRRDGIIHRQELSHKIGRFGRLTINNKRSTLYSESRLRLPHGSVQVFCLGRGYGRIAVWNECLFSLMRGIFIT